MPSTRPQAAFEPVAPSLDLKQLVESTPNFEWATRIHCDMIDHHGLDQFERLVLVHVVLGGKPLVIEGYENRLDKWTFAVQWLKDNHGPKVVDVRELNKDANVPMTMEHYLKHMSPLTNQWTDNNYKEEGRQRMYLKDMDCPDLWHEKLRDQIPLMLFYLNENTGDIGGFGSGTLGERNLVELNKRNKRGIAKAGDLMSSLPKDMRAENLMCYIGHEGTYTPAHREMCASLGHNIMVETSRNAIEDGKLTKAGSSIWFMTETKEREVVSEYWLSRLGHDIEIEKHFAQLNAWKHAPFKTYVVEQKLGDFILIPPLAPHQVWNRGTRTMKVAWNRTTVETLEMAMTEALFKARFVCRDEQYKNKAIIFYTMQKYSKLLREAEKLKRAGSGAHQSDLKVKQLEKDFKRLHGMFTNIMISETLLPDQRLPKIEFIPFDGNVTCSYCRCNIFNRFLTCPSCVGKLPNGDDDTYDICMECYAMGRSCACISRLQWVEQFKYDDLFDMHEDYRRQIINAEQRVDGKSPRSLRIELAYLEKKRTLAQICQVEVSRRPWNDITRASGNGTGQDVNGVDREEEIELDINGNVKKTKKKVRRSEKYIREHGRCHIDCYWEPKWKQAHCSKCDKNYCFGNLFRAYDEMPQDILANPDWECPSCRKICGCRACRNKPGYKKYTPKGTLLGHNTKAVADPRSVESLVDFSHSNIAWIQKAGDDHEENTLRLQRRRKDADLAKARDTQLGDDYVSETPENIEESVLQLAQQEGIPIDPALSSGDLLVGRMDPDDEDTIVEHPEAPRHNQNATPEDGVEEEQWVPEGGIMWDSAHAYDTTDAITYVYPDFTAPLVSTQIPPEPSEGYQQIVPGYEEGVPSSPNKIEMVDRKRKRLKLDDGDRPYKWKKGKMSLKSKSRKSLVVKLLVNGDRLAEIESTASQANKSSEAHTAPVIGSDLQTLNNDYREPDVPAPVNVAGLDLAGEEGEQDDEFTPGRYRDRRKLNADGLTRPPPDADITRRTTRMQAVTYADPSDGEEEFNETLPTKSPTSKLATMENAVRTLDGTIERPPTQEHVNNQPRPKRAEKAKQLASSSASIGGHSTAIIPPSGKQVSVTRGTTNKTPVLLGRSTDSSRRSSTDSVSSIQVAPRVLAEAQANRKAKMAAIEGGDEGSTEGWSDDDNNNRPEPVPPPAPTKFSVGSKAPRLSLPSSIMHKATPPATVPAPTAISIQKVSAADWDDSSSDEDLPYTRPNGAPKTITGFVAVNGRHGVSRLTSNNKKRGRPAKTK